MIFIPNAKASERRLRVASYLLRKGYLVAFPTETVYGLGANALIKEAVQKVFAAKGRSPENPLIVHVSSREDVERVARYIPKTAEKLIKVFWPGPLTVVLPKSTLLPDVVTGGRDTVAVRMPAHEIALELIAGAGGLVVAPSANRSGRPSPTRAEHVLEDLSDAVDCIVDGGETPGGIESTIIDVTKEPPVVVRPGAVDIEEIERIVGKVRVSEKEWPGDRYRHYSPDVELILVEGDSTGERTSKIAENYLKKGLKVAVIGPKAPLGVVHIHTENVEELAKILFSTLRRLEGEVDLILVRGVDEKGIGMAVMHRLKKAASKVLRFEPQNV